MEVCKRGRGVSYLNTCFKYLMILIFKFMSFVLSQKIYRHTYIHSRVLNVHTYKKQSILYYTYLKMILTWVNYFYFILQRTYRFSFCLRTQRTNEPLNEWVAAFSFKMQPLLSTVTHQLTSRMLLSATCLSLPISLVLSLSLIYNS